MGERKNVVVLVLDSLRKDRISVYNDEVDFTPNMEEIAEGSRVYTNANSQAPWTLPSHASMFTGLYPWEHGATQKFPKLETDKKCLAERFKENGYRTALITPNVNLSEAKGTARGFEDVENFLGIMKISFIRSIWKKFEKIIASLGERNRKKVESIKYKIFDSFFDKTKNRETVEKTKEFIEEVDDEEFFLFVNLMSPHEPYKVGDPPERYIRRRNIEDFSGVPETEREFLGNEIDLEKTRKAYDAAVDYTDDLVGEINKSLIDNDLKEETILVLMSDHGQALGDEGVFTHAFTLTESVIETVLIVDDPSIKEKNEKSRLFELRQVYDLLPNIAGISDKEISELSLVKGSYEYPEIMAGSIPKDREEDLYKKLRYVKDDSRKIVKSINKEGRASYRMIEVETGEEKEIEADMKREVDEIGEVEEDGEVETDEEIKKRLKQLGYK
jgi:arylsulfatase A-like enzyme